MIRAVLEAHRLAVSEVASAVDTDPRRGLSAAEAARRLAEIGRNELTAERPVPAWRRFLAQFSDVLVILLVVATRRTAADHRRRDPRRTSSLV